ncbi:MAG TPA: hypothetical protein VJU85_04000 [Nitrososphaeraceae archaeon]|nr:hypothetical protein [Nitrososphaeraceae archaeon]
MTLPSGYKPPKKKEISDSKDFENNNNTTNKKNNRLTDELLQSTTLDDTINKVLERGNEVVTSLEDTVKEAIEKGKDIITEDSSTLENQMNKKNENNYNDNFNLRINTDKSLTKEELITTTIPTSIKEEENKDMTENSTNNSEDYKIQRKDESIKDKIFGKMSDFIGETGSKEKGSTFAIKSIIFGLFALIGFIIIVYSILIGVVGEPLASVADTVFVAALIGSFTIVGVIVSYSFLKK